MAQGRSTEIISMIELIRTSRSSITNSLSHLLEASLELGDGRAPPLALRRCHLQGYLTHKKQPLPLGLP